MKMRNDEFDKLSGDLDKANEMLLELLKPTKENKKKELLELFDLANVEPELAKKIIEPQIDKPYTRESASNITRDNIIKFRDYHVQNYYKDTLYKLWNYAEKVKKER